MSADDTATRQTFLQRIAARNAEGLWGGPLMKIGSKLPPALLSKFAGLLGPDDFARSIAAASDEQLEEAMQGKMRGVILGEVVRRMSEEFISERASDLDTVIQLQVTGRPDGGDDYLQLKIKDGKCEASPGQPFTNEPASNIVISAVDFLKLTAGIANGVDLYIGGKIKFDGGMMVLTRLTRMFNIPDPTGGAKDGKPAKTAGAAKAA
jgi:putative sterol carrier protein